MSSAWSASGAAPPYMPEWAGRSMVETVTSTLPVPRRDVVSVGWPSSTLPVSARTSASHRTKSGRPRSRASVPPLDCSSDPSQTTAISTGQPPHTSCSACRASRVATRLPFAVRGASAEPPPRRAR